VESAAKGEHLSPGDRLCKQQSQVATAAASLQIGGHVFPGQRAGQMAQALPGLGVVRIQDDEAGLALLVKKICAHPMCQYE
jgi:hypothetical protein